MATDHPDPPYRISCSEAIKSELRKLHRRAARHGRGQEVLSALRILDERLTADALSWGDPHFRLHGMNLLVFNRIQQPLQIVYAVDEARRIAYVTNVRFVFEFPGHETD
jgi:hypothetical protein